MSGQSLVRFGVFELDPRTREIRKRGVKIKLQEQPFRILLLLLESPGELVSREHLQQTLWPTDTFVDFEHSLNAAVAKLRVALGDSAENPRFVERVARGGYRFIAPVERGSAEERELSLPSPAPNPASTQGNKRRIRPARVRRAMLFAAALSLIVGAIVTVVFLRARELTRPVLRRITWDSGFSADPSLSRDGKLVVYASDRAGHGNLNLWLQHTAGGEPLQLTRDPVDERQPTFSPDGSRIAFRMDLGEGGIYIIPTLGGEPRLFAKRGLKPRFSPDGNWIAWWEGWHWGLFAAISGGEVFLAPSTGGQPVAVKTGLAIAGNPIWSPDGSHLLVYGERERGVRYQNTADWWVVPAGGGDPIKTGAFDVFRRHGISTEKLSASPTATDWTGDQVMFTAKVGDSVDLWRVPISRTWRITGSPEHMTSGVGFVEHATANGEGQAAFAGLTQKMNIWSLPLNPVSGAAAGELRQLTNAAAFDLWPAVNSSGALLAFTSTRTGNRDLWKKDLVSGAEAILTPTPSVAEETPKLSADGSQVAYSRVEGHTAAVYILGTEGGIPAKVTEECDVPWGWSQDGKFLLCKWKWSPGVRLLNLKTGGVTEILQARPPMSLWQATLSPDDRWLAFLASNVRGVPGSEIFVAPFRGATSIPETDWIRIADGPRFDDKPRWSTDGRLIYFTSLQDGHRCVWAQRLDTRTKQPTGTPFPVYHSHAARRSIVNDGMSLIELSVARDQLVFNMNEFTGNIWTMSR